MVPLREELIGARGEVRNRETATVVGQCHTSGVDEQHHGASYWLTIGAEGYGAFNGAAVLGVDRWRQTANDGRYEYENKKIELVNHNRPPWYNGALRENSLGSPVT